MKSIDQLLCVFAKLRFYKRTSDYVQKCLELDRSVLSKLSSLKCLITEISLQELRNKIVIKITRDLVKYAEIILRTLSVEHFVLLFLNKSNAIIDHIDIRCSHDNVQVDYQFIIKRAIVSETISIICDT